MVIYNFKKLRTVPTSSGLIDSVLSKTQRQTPTEIHPQYHMTRIREFYIRKVKFVSQTFHDRLQMILDDFPQIDSIHPFYADLINILYDKDHYKLALGQMNVSKTLVDTIGKEYVKQLKNADSGFRCKSLKKVAMGRMATLVRKQKATLEYLEQVRQHLSRLPVIDPVSRTLIVAGYPNVGKSSFMNKITRANVEVQDYPFTTKSLFVGHFDYEFEKWQAIDTPGILDTPLEDRNTIEMQSIAAMAHLKSAVLFFIDISELCGYSLESQTSLFTSILPLFSERTIVLVLSKVDARKPQELNDEAKLVIEDLAWKFGCKQKPFLWSEEPGVPIFKDDEKSFAVVGLSSLEELGVDAVKNCGCQMLLRERVEKKLRTGISKGILNRLNVSYPKYVDESRTAVVPDSVGETRTLEKEDPTVWETLQKTRILERDLEKAAGGFGVYNVDVRKVWKLDNEDWKYDEIPEIIEGKNIFDFIDPDIDRKLEDLQKEEEDMLREIEERENLEQMARGGEGELQGNLLELTGAQEELLDRIREKRANMRSRTTRERRIRRVGPTGQEKERKLERFTEHLEEIGLEPENVSMETSEMVEKKTERKRMSRKQLERDLEKVNQVVKIGEGTILAKDRSRLTSSSVDPRQRGYKSTDELKKQKRAFEKKADITKIDGWVKAGYSDRRIPDEKPKHLYTGKRSIGKTDRR